MDIPDMSDLVPELICLGVDAVICGILYKVYSDTNSTIEAVKVRFIFKKQWVLKLHAIISISSLVANMTNLF